jgi:GNAT superfamily N-acetyltransferase
MTIVIRPLQVTDSRSLRHLFRRSFNWMKLPFLPDHPPGFVAIKGEQICGGIVVKIFSLPGGQRGGTILSLATAPEVRGQGVGQRLVEAALDFLQDQGCHQILTCVEGHNTSSSQQFATRGFRVLSLGQQWRAYGWRLPYIWYKTGHLGDIGHFLWCRGVDLPLGRPEAAWLTSGVGNGLAVALMLWRRGATDVLSWSALGLVVLMVAGMIGLREAGMGWVARWRGLATRHYGWESGSLIAILAALLGGFFPVPGNRYPAQLVWRYRDLRSHLGWIALGGIVPILLLAYGCSWGLRLGLPDPATNWLRLARFTALLLVGWDALVPVYPFNCFNSRRLWQWHPSIWAGVAILCLIGISLP